MPRLARRIALPAAVLLVGVSCALPPARWDVPEGAEPRFREARHACNVLTAPDAARFEDCMQRRGFERESLWRRSWRGLTGR